MTPDQTLFFPDIWQNNDDEKSNETQPDAIIFECQDLEANWKHEDEKKNSKDSPAFSFSGMVEVLWEREEKKKIIVEIAQVRRILMIQTRTVKSHDLSSALRTFLNKCV